MKLILESWKKFLVESHNNTIKFEGILLLVPDDSTKQELLKLADKIKQDNPDAIALSPDKMHVTLAHQSILKPYKDKIKELVKTNKLPELPPIKLGEVITKIGEGDQAGRKSWAVVIKNQQDFQSFINELMTKVGGPQNPEQRQFHISLANLTGQPGDSVR